ncbi:MAG: AAA family ATPase [Anaerolineae bacterium]|uniref:Lon protease family protein n=1 Tax=Promineifilum sp. TaxID=2664178 RepID=UPI001E183E9B|nr:AAA family ATPase [Anaerolineales bacterium]MCO5181401.1 AAA family ATPase [Promineifilum sp.]MCW5846319.1 AAA family ATPase [Anaerolineae bacterium]
MKPLSPNNLRLVCDPASLTFETTAELQPTTAIIGQPRATKALEFGMGLKSKGYNIFVTGSTGTGRSTAIRHFLQERCGREATPDDLLYLYNFEAAHRPQAISLPPGQGSHFVEHMKRLIEAIQSALTQAFESSSYREAIHALEQKLVEQREEKLDALDRRATEQGFDLQDSPAGLVIMVAGEEEAGEPVANGELQARRETHRGLQMELQSILREVRIVERDAREERRRLDQQVAEAAVQDEFDALREKYAEQSIISDYLDAVREDLVEQVTRAAPALDEKDLDQIVDLRRYEVNVLVNNADGKGAPVIVQLNPTYENLFGRLEYETQGHAMTTHFTQIRAGDLHRANGGYLVMYALDLIRQRETWEALKRALKAQEIEMRSPSSDAPAIANSLWPQPVPLNLKIILLGHSNLYESLYWNDEEFSDLFKVRADFSDTMPRDPANELSYAEFVASRSQEEKLRPFGRTAVAKIIEHGARLAEYQCKLSTRFGAIADLARESDYWAGIDGHDVVTADDVRNALNERTHRASQEAEQVREEILEGMIFIATEGEIVGQVNGLSVREVGDFSFGHPGCISARTFMGESGVIHIERETEMDGPIHEKGVLTLNGYLGGTYAQHQPLSMSASLTFEQTYGGIDGDSASSSELYALISSLSGLPARQSISVTGSVNQRGEIQPIGAVNEKIEGFFDVCQARGLTGDQGVLIPATNIVNLMLREDVVDAVGKGLFHIWPVSNINEGIELLMGRPAGEPDDDGEYAEGTVHHAVKKRLMELAMELKSFGDDRGHDQIDEEN